MFARFFALGLSGVVSLGLFVALTWDNLPKSIRLENFVPEKLASIPAKSALPVNATPVTMQGTTPVTATATSLSPTSTRAEQGQSSQSSITDVFFRDSGTSTSGRSEAFASGAHASARPIKVSSRQFGRLSRQGLVLVKFGADWCGPCRSVESELEQLAVENSGDLTVLTVDVDEEPELASRYGVGAIPHFGLFRDGTQIDEWTGFKSADVLQDAI